MEQEKILSMFEEVYKIEQDYDRIRKMIKLIKKPSPELQSHWDYIRGKYVGLSKSISLIGLNVEYVEYYVKRIMSERSY